MVLSIKPGHRKYETEYEKVEISKADTEYSLSAAIKSITDSATDKGDFAKSFLSIARFAKSEEKNSPIPEKKVKSKLVDLEEEHANKVMRMITKIELKVDKYAYLPIYLIYYMLAQIDVLFSGSPYDGSAADRFITKFFGGYVGIEKANVATMQFTTEIQALLEDQNIKLTDSEKEALEELVGKVNRAMEDRAKELSDQLFRQDPTGIEKDMFPNAVYEAINSEQLEAAKKFIKALYTKEKQELEKVIEEYYNTIASIAAQHYGFKLDKVSKWINESLEEYKKIYFELAEALKERAEMEKEETKEIAPMKVAQMKLLREEYMHG